jgi:hypothetical protein
MSRIRWRRAGAGWIVVAWPSAAAWSSFVAVDVVADSAIAVGVAAVPSGAGVSPFAGTVAVREESVSFMRRCVPAADAGETCKTAARAQM